MAADGPFVYLGFRPLLVLKENNSFWNVLITRKTSNSDDPYLVWIIVMQKQVFLLIF